MILRNNASASSNYAHWPSYQAHEYTSNNVTKLESEKRIRIRRNTILINLQIDEFVEINVQVKWEDFHLEKILMAYCVMLILSGGKNKNNMVKKRNKEAYLLIDLDVYLIERVSMIKTLGYRPQKVIKLSKLDALSRR